MDEAREHRDPELWATILFVPADRPEMLAKAQARGADAILVDLEDAIPQAGKTTARRELRERLAGNSMDGPSAVCARINAVDEGADEDLAALEGLSLDAIVLAKATSAWQLQHIRAQINWRLVDGPEVALIPQVESAAGVLEVGELASVYGVDAIALGGEDLCVDLGVSRSKLSIELLIPRALVALHARAAGLAAIDTVYTTIEDEEGLAREATVARQLGFTGKLLIHPAQIEPVEQVFRPSGEEVAWALRILGGESADEAAGVRLVDGKMVDAPVVAQAERILARSR
jgi:citrate lyase subunit beta/citryl-CoA lyase